MNQKAFSDRTLLSQNTIISILLSLSIVSIFFIGSVHIVRSFATDLSWMGHPEQPSGVSNWLMWGQVVHRRLIALASVYFYYHSNDFFYSFEAIQSTR
jgi:hypothetical protein